MELDVRSGVATPFRGYDDLLMTDALQYFPSRETELSAMPRAHSARRTGHDPDAVKAIYGVDRDGNNPSIPAFIFSEQRTHADHGYAQPEFVRMARARQRRLDLDHARHARDELVEGRVQSRPGDGRQPARDGRGAGQRLQRVFQFLESAGNGGL